MKFADHLDEGTRQRLRSRAAATGMSGSTPPELPGRAQVVKPRPEDLLRVRSRRQPVRSPAPETPKAAVAMRPRATTDNALLHELCAQIRALERGLPVDGSDPREPTSATAARVRYLLDRLHQRCAQKAEAGQPDARMTQWVRQAQVRAGQLIRRELPQAPARVLKVGPVGPSSPWFYAYADEGK